MLEVGIVVQHNDDFRKLLNIWQNLQRNFGEWSRRHTGRTAHKDVELVDEVKPDGDE
jgi:hypothetical protein